MRAVELQCRSSHSSAHANRRSYSRDAARATLCSTAGRLPPARPPSAPARPKRSQSAAGPPSRPPAASLRLHKPHDNLRPALPPCSHRPSTHRNQVGKRKGGGRTLNLGHASNEDITLQLLVAELLLHVGQDRLDELALLGLAHLRLVTNPRVEDRLDLGGEGRLLAQGESLVLELGGLLRFTRGQTSAGDPVGKQQGGRGTDLGQLEEGLGEGLDVLHLANILDATLDGVRVSLTSSVEDSLDLLLVCTPIETEAGG